MANALPPPDWPISSTGNISVPWYNWFKEVDETVRDTTASVATHTTATTYIQASVLSATTASALRTNIGVNAADTTGSWTPELAINGTTVAAGYSVQAGRYVRGQSGRVQAWGTITITTRGVTTGPMTITGLPVASVSDPAGIIFSGVVGRITGLSIASSQQPIGCHLTTGATALTFTRWNADNTGVVNLASTHLTTAASIAFSISYETSA